VLFEVDLEAVGGDIRVRSRTARAINQSRILWIYLHGIELKKKDKKNKWNKHWLCKLCYDAGTIKLYAAKSTASYNRHLNTFYGLYAPGV